ncbi:MAG: right-handed parallel beta-helix repeat-containing protein [Candidatus Thorarchaeota archaeon]
MVGKNFSIIVCCIFILAMVPQSPSILIPPYTSYTVSQESVYTQHDKINIRYNEDLVAQGWPGDGTPENPYLIEGLNITIESDTCITIYRTDAYLIIRNCHLYSERYTAIRIDYANNCLVENNTVHGISLYKSSDCTVLSNNLPDSSIALSYSRDMTVVSNTIGSAFWISGNQIQHWIHNTSDNLVRGLPFGYFINEKNHIISPDDYGALILANCTDILITDGSVLGTPPVLRLGFCTNCTISDNSNYVISMYYSERCTVRNNSLRSNEATGIALYSCSHIDVQDNIVCFNEINGIGVFDSSNCTIRQNNVSGYTGYIPNVFGTHLWHAGVTITGSPNCTVIDNILSGNPDSGIYASACSDLVVTGNLAYNNTNCGIEIGGAYGTVVNNELVSNNGPGINIRGYDNSTIARNVLSYNGGGIMVESHCYNLTIEDNDITDCQIGIELEASLSLSIINNTLEGTGIFIKGGYVFFGEPNLTEWHHTIEDNTLGGAPIGYWWGIESASLNLTGYGQAIIINCTGLTISGGIFSNSGPMIAFCNDSVIEDMSSENCASYGLYLRDCFDLTVNGCSFTNNSNSGLYIHASYGCHLYNNQVESNSYGLTISNSETITVSSNNIEHNQGAAISFYYSSTCIVSDNIFVDNGVVFVGGPTQWQHGFHNNTINGNQLGYFKELNDTTLDISNYGAIILVSCHGVVMEGGTIHNSTIGLQMGYCSDCIISRTSSSNSSIAGVRSIGSPSCLIIDNRFSNNEIGMEIGTIMGGYGGISIINCTITGNNIGVDITYANNMIILDSIISDNTYDGVNLYRSYGCHIENCTISKNGGDGISNWYAGAYGKFIANEINENGGYGITGFGSYSEVADNQICYNRFSGLSITFGYNSKITNNQIVANNGSGIWIYYSDNCTILDNFVCNNTEFGIKIGQWDPDDNVNNTLYGNSIGWNIAGNALDDGLDNHWDNGITGNAWSDYIGYGEYYVSGTAGGIDRYPATLLSFDGDVAYPPDVTDLTDTTSNQANIPDSFFTSMIIGIVVIEIVFAVIILWYSKVHKKS